jgi:hypothetical protein
VEAGVQKHKFHSSPRQRPPRKPPAANPRPSAVFFEPQLGEAELAENEFKKRLDSLSAVLKKFSDELGELKPKSTRAEYVFDGFEAGGVAQILPYHFARSGVPSARDEARSLSLKDLRRTANLAEDLLKKRLPGFYRRILEALWMDATATINVRKWSLKRYQGKCPIVSEIVTDLSTYLITAHGVRVVFDKRAALYRFIGRIVETFSSPLCLFCGRTHQFKDWRGVQRRDRHRRIPLGSRGDLIRQDWFVGRHLPTERRVQTLVGEAKTKAILNAVAEVSRSSGMPLETQRLVQETMMEAAVLARKLADVRAQISWPLLGTWPLFFF